jgi:hypothetical protein
MVEVGAATFISVYGIQIETGTSTKVSGNVIKRAQTSCHRIAQNASQK